MNIKDTFIWESEVRYNETDLQGIVSNSNYSIYLTLARNKHLKSIGIDFNRLHDDGYDLVLVRTEIDFKASLRNSEEFIVTSSFKPMGRIRMAFAQQIIRKSDQKIIVEAKTIATCISAKSSRPTIPDELKCLFA